MRRELTLTDDTRAFVLAQRVARLATVDAAGRPHVVPICFALSGDVLYSVIDEKPKSGDHRRLQRLRNIERNPHVQILCDIYDDHDWSSLRFVQLRGTASVLESGLEYDDALQLLRARYPQYRAMALEARPVIAVHLRGTVVWRRSTLLAQERGDRGYTSAWLPAAMVGSMSRNCFPAKSW